MLRAPRWAPFVTGNFHFERYLRPLTYSLSVACRVGRQLTLYYPPELTNRQNQTLQKGKRKRKEAPDRDRQVSVPPVSLSVQVVERGVDSVAAIERVKENVTKLVIFEFSIPYAIYSDYSKFAENDYSPLTMYLN